MHHEEGEYKSGIFFPSFFFLSFCCGDKLEKINLRLLMCRICVQKADACAG